MVCLKAGSLPPSQSQDPYRLYLYIFLNKQGLVSIAWFLLKKGLNDPTIFLLAVPGKLKEAL